MFQRLIFPLIILFYLQNYGLGSRYDKYNSRQNVIRVGDAVGARSRRAYFKPICADPHEIFLPAGVVPCIGDMKCDNLVPRFKPFFNGKPGCYCRAGFARNCKGQCVPTEQCEKRACDGPNEAYFTPNDDPPPCDPQCNRLDRMNTCSKSERANPRSCGCFCIDGAARDANGTCVPIVNCPMTKRKCYGTNEVYYNAENAPADDRYCDNSFPLEDSTDDYGECKEGRAGCYCRDGYFRNEVMLCVERRFCRVKCPGKHEVFLPAGSAPRCELRCTKNCPKSWRACLQPLDMPMGCYCQKGFCKNEYGCCIRQTQKCKVIKINACATKSPCKNKADGSR